MKLFAGNSTHDIGVPLSIFSFILFFFLSFFLRCHQGFLLCKCLNCMRKLSVFQKNTLRGMGLS